MAAQTAADQAQSKFLDHKYARLQDLITRNQARYDPELSKYNTSEFFLVYRDKKWFRHMNGSARHILHYNRTTGFTVELDNGFD